MKSTFLGGTPLDGIKEYWYKELKMECINTILESLDTCNVLYSLFYTL